MNATPARVESHDKMREKEILVQNDPPQYPVELLNQIVKKYLQK